MTRSLLLPLLLLGCLPLPARAVLGEDMDALRKRFGRPEPQVRAQKNTAMWFIETRQGDPLIYTVTFNAKGRAIAEGLKPHRRAVLTAEMAQAFIDSQREPHRGAASTRAVKPGEKYTFARQEFTCAANEVVFVDETNDFLIIWVRGDQSAVMAVRAEMLKPAS
jgi:hypothetical protein